MPKMKSHSGAKKRFKPTSGGTQLKRACQNKNHILNKKTRERKRKLRHGDYVDATQIKTITLMVGAGGKKLYSKPVKCENNEGGSK